MHRHKHKSHVNPPRPRGSEEQPGTPQEADPTREELDRIYATADSDFDKTLSSDSETFLRQSKQTGGQ